MRKIFTLSMAIMVGAPGTLFAATTCPNNHTNLTTGSVVRVAQTTFSAPVDNHCAIAGYSIMTIPDLFEPLYVGFTDGATQTLCGGDAYLSGNSCVPFEQSNCEGGYNKDAAIAKSTFMRTLDNDSRCAVAGYSVYTNVTDQIYAIYDGFVEGATQTLCGGGKHLNSSGACVSYAQGECPNNFLSIAPTDATFATRNLGTCATGYGNFTIHQQCDDNRTDSMCAVLCSGGLLYTDVGTCASICHNSAIRYLNVVKDGNRWTFPLYSERQIDPSLAFEYNGDTCYVNLLSGEGVDALNIKKDDGTTYHTVQ